MVRDFDRAAGSWVRKQATRRSAIVWGFVALLVGLAFAALVLLLSDRATIATSVVVIVLALALKRVVDHRADEAVQWLLGARAEQFVGEELERLRGDGYLVVHDVDWIDQGNVDHVVSGPSGVFMVETKARGYLKRHLAKARGQAGRLHDRLGVWVTPVICVNRPEGEPYRAHGVWVVPHHAIVDWVREQRNASLDESVLRARL